MQHEVIQRVRKSQRARCEGSHVVFGPWDLGVGFVKTPRFWRSNAVSFNGPDALRSQLAGTDHPRGCRPGPRAGSQNTRIFPRGRHIGDEVGLCLPRNESGGERAWVYIGILQPYSCRRGSTPEAGVDVRSRTCASIFHGSCPVSLESLEVMHLSVAAHPDSICRSPFHALSTKPSLPPHVDPQGTPPPCPQLV